MALQTGDYIKLCHNDERFWAKIQEIDGEKVMTRVDNDRTFPQPYESYRLPTALSPHIAAYNPSRPSGEALHTHQIFIIALAMGGSVCGQNSPKSHSFQPSPKSPLPVSVETDGASLGMIGMSVWELEKDCLVASLLAPELYRPKHLGVGTAVVANSLKRPSVPDLILDSFV